MAAEVSSYLSNRGYRTACAFAASTDAFEWQQLSQGGVLPENAKVDAAGIDSSTEGGRLLLFPRRGRWLESWVILLPKARADDIRDLAA
jgi:hypothetical protein